MENAIGQILLADKRNRVHVCRHRKAISVCLSEHKGMNIHCPIFSAVCFIYLFKCFLSLRLSNPFLCLFFPLPYVLFHKSTVEVQKQQMCFLTQSLGFGVRNKDKQRIVFGFGARSYSPQNSSKTTERSYHTSTCTIRVAKCD